MKQIIKYLMLVIIVIYCNREVCNIFRTLVIVVNYFWKTPHLRCWIGFWICPQLGKRANLQTGATRKQNLSSFPKNKHFLPYDTHTCLRVSGGKKSSIFGKLGVLCFLVMPVLRFAHLPYYRRICLCSKYYNFFDIFLSQNNLLSLVKLHILYHETMECETFLHLNTSLKLMY